MSPKAPLLRPSHFRHSPSRYEAFPPWLLSTIVHMACIIALGLLHIGITPGSNLKLMLTPAEDVADSDFDSTGLIDVGIALEAEPIRFTPVIDPAFPPTSEETHEDFEAGWNDFATVSSSATALISGLGDGELSKRSEGKGYASVFGLSGEGGKFVYVFDRSESMNSIFTLYSEGQLVSMITPLQSAKQELVRSLDSLSEDSQFQIVFYNDSPQVFGHSHYIDELYSATEEHKELAHQFVSQIRGQGFTNHLSALEAAITLNPDVIFLLTDAETKDDLHPDVVRRMSKHCQRHNIAINVVHFCNSPRSESTLVRLAENTGGEHIFISLQSLAEAMVNPITQ